MTRTGSRCEYHCAWDHPQAARKQVLPQVAVQDWASLESCEGMLQRASAAGVLEHSCHLLCLLEPQRRELGIGDLVWPSLRNCMMDRCCNANPENLKQAEGITCSCHNCRNILHKGQTGLLCPCRRISTRRVMAMISRCLMQSHAQGRVMTFQTQQETKRRFSCLMSAVRLEG